MTEHRNPDVRTLWQAQPPEGEPMSIETVRRQVRALEKESLRKDIIIYGCGVVNTAAFAVAMWYLPRLRIVSAIVIATALYIVYQYHRRRPVRAAMDDAGAIAAYACVDFYRTALVRKRDMARQLWTWFLPPAILGQIALIAGFTIWPPNIPRRLMLMVLPFWLLTDVIIFTFGWRNAQREVQKAQRELDALEAIEEGRS